MPYSIPLARQIVVVALTAGFLTSCSDEQPRPELPAQPQEQVTAERDKAAIAEATAAAVKLILEEDTIVNTRLVSDSCGEPHEGGMAPGFGGPNAVDILPHWAGFLEIGADRPLVTTDASRTSNGYILFTPGAFKETYLMNTDKQVVATHLNSGSRLPRTVTAIQNCSTAGTCYEPTPSMSVSSAGPRVVAFMGA